MFVYIGYGWHVAHGLAVTTVAILDRAVHAVQELAPLFFIG
jgi:hypothetical protein